MRLAKHLARCGVASRRAAEQIVAAGRVTVDGVIVRDPAHAVDERAAVAVDGRAIELEPAAVFVVNKPPGVVSTASDTHGRPTVVELVPRDLRLYPVGRLDAETTGLILLTNDGELADLLTHPRYGVEKSYRARVEPSPIAEAALARLRAGVDLEDGPTAPARVRQVRPGLVELTIAEGRKRQVRRMLEAVGHRVIALERHRFGPLGLERAGPGGAPLAVGEHRQLTPAEVERLRKAVRGALGESPG